MILKFVTKILDSKYFFFSFVPLMGAVAIFAIFFTLSQNFSIVHTGHSIKEGKLDCDNLTALLGRRKVRVL